MSGRTPLRNPRVGEARALLQRRIVVQQFRRLQVLLDDYRRRGAGEVWLTRAQAQLLYRGMVV